MKSLNPSQIPLQPRVGQNQENLQTMNNPYLAQLTMQQQNDLDAFMKNISPSLALRVRGHMFEKELRENNKIIRQT